MSVRTVTTLVRAAPAEASETESTTTAAESRAWSRPEITLETLELGDQHRPKGRRFGALVHALLASIDLDAGVDAIKSGAAINGRLVGATELEIHAAVATVRGVLAHPILRRAA